MGRKHVPNEIEIKDGVCYVRLNHGRTMKIDPEDWPKISFIRWGTIAPKKGKAHYAIASQWNPETKKYHPIFAHRVITDCPKGLTVDHKNHDTLDNRRSNLLVCTMQQNAWNKRSHLKNKTGIRGVSIQTSKEGKKYYLARMTLTKTLPFTEEGKEVAANLVEEWRKALDIPDHAKHYKDES